MSNEEHNENQNENPNENRFVTIESKLAEQEDLTDTLSRTIYRQQQKIDQLEELFSALARRMKDNADGSTETLDERPPHY
jgi:SlyX protein